MYQERLFQIKSKKNEKYFSATHEEENEDCMPNERLLHFFRK